MIEPPRKPLDWVGKSKRDLLSFPKKVRQDIGYALDEIQRGETPVNAKILKGISGVMELIENYDTDTYRAVYATTIGDRVYVLHCFKKKSKSGIKTTKQDIDLIRKRLKAAKNLN